MPLGRNEKATEKGRGIVLISIMQRTSNKINYRNTLPHKKGGKMYKIILPPFILLFMLSRAGMVPTQIYTLTLF